MKNPTNQARIFVATAHDPRWSSVVSRDPKADGTFYYSVKTTGVYCRPSCRSRLALPKNVRFHTTCEDAEKAGFRPCKRCIPNQPAWGDRHTETVIAACRFIEKSEKALSLKELATYAGLSIYHFHRLFKATTGLTPKDYVTAHRANRVRTQLHRRGTVTDAIYEAGYNSSGRFYETANDVLGMTPSTYRAGGAWTTIRFAVGSVLSGRFLSPTVNAASARSNLGMILGN